MRIKIYLKPFALGGFLCLNFFGLTINSYANSIPTGRYLSVADQALPEQQHLLQQQIQVHFPTSIKTINQAMNFLLKFSGYQLATIKEMPVSAQIMLKQPLPEVDRNFGPMTLQEALTTLAGDSFYLLVDPINRKLVFQIKPQYQALFERFNLEH